MVPPRPARRRSLSARILIFITKTAVGAFIFSLIWVGLYRFMPVLITWPMASDYVKGHHVERTWVTLAAINPDVARAAIGAEDSRFCEHNGFDFDAMEAAAAQNAAGGKLRGGSTISQQTAKNAFLWPGRSYVRKGLEAYFTVLIETIWGKPRIMEVYLNIAEMGPGIYGVEAAAQHYFHTSAANLNPQQASRIAAILPQPEKRNAAAPGRYVRRYANRIQKRIGVVERNEIDGCLR